MRLFRLATFRRPSIRSIGNHKPQVLEEINNAQYSTPSNEWFLEIGPSHWLLLIMLLLYCLLSMQVKSCWLMCHNSCVERRKITETSLTIWGSPLNGIPVSVPNFSIPRIVCVNSHATTTFRMGLETQILFHKSKWSRQPSEIRYMTVIKSTGCGIHEREFH